MRSILITGGAGFIGSNLIKRLLTEEESTITCIDNFDPFYDKGIKLRNIASFLKNDRFSLVEGDITRLEELEDVLPRKVDVIVHLAAKAGVRPSILNPVDYQMVNYVGTQKMLEYARRSQIEQFVFASSSSVYGINENTPWVEDDHYLQPISPYAASKVASEGLGRVYSHLYDIRFLALRFFTVYGPGQRPDLAIHKFSRMLMDKEPITVFGNGNTQRDYTYIDDIVSGIIAAMTYSATRFEIINIGNNHTISLKELIENIELTFENKAELVYMPEQGGDVSKTFANIDKAARLLNYHPKWDLQAGLKMFRKWYEDTFQQIQA